MRAETIAHLNAINRRFYRCSAEEFLRTRRGPWRGWRRLLELARPALKNRGPLRVLDVGCGNGRLLELLDGSADYLGVDFSPPLLEWARGLSTAVATARFLEFDLLEAPLTDRLPPGGFDLIVVLGLLHHIAAHRTRRRLLEECARLLAPGGVLGVSFWDFERVSRLVALRAPWSSDTGGGGPEIDPSDLERGDHLLRFGPAPGALRYCHCADPAERRKLIAATGLKLQAEFHADGREGNLNHYFLLCRT